MKDIRSTVMQLSGRWGNTCYATLCLAVEAALDLPYGDVQMKHLWSAIHERTGKSPQAISRALARAAADVWERGNQELLEAIQSRTKIILKEGTYNFSELDCDSIKNPNIENKSLIKSIDIVRSPAAGFPLLCRTEVRRIRHRCA